MARLNEHCYQFSFRNGVDLSVLDFKAVALSSCRACRGGAPIGEAPASRSGRSRWWWTLARNAFKIEWCGDPHRSPTIVKHAHMKPILQLLKSLQRSSCRNEL